MRQGQHQVMDLIYKLKE